MSAPRLRLYQYEYCADCIPVRMLLQHSGVPHEIVNLTPGDPAPVIELTRGKYYQTPVVFDLLSSEAIFQEGAEDQRIARYICALAKLDLFPRELAGVQEVVTRYIQREVAPTASKICFAYGEQWLKTNVERGLVRRHNERKFGEGCMEQWRESVTKLIEEFFVKLHPLVRMLVQSPFLLGDRVTYADYALAGVIGNYLYSGATTIPSEWVMLSAWYDKVKAGKFEDQWNPDTASAGGAEESAATEEAVDLKDLEAVVGELKMRAGRKALDAGCGHGHAGLYLAGLGLDVTLCDVSADMIDQVVLCAAEKELKISIQQHAPEQMPYGDGTFDLVVCLDAARRFNAPEPFMKETARVLKMYGYAVIVDQAGLEDHPEANQWMDELERLRNPAHVRFVRQSEWKRWAEQYGLRVTRSEVRQVKMENFNRYLSRANMTPENRQKAMEHVARAPTAAREVFKIGQNEGVIFWTIRRLVFVAGKI
jgi:glutathione S-transferase